jgi:hypothetical protein
MTKFTAGWNTPGYLPETDPAEFDNFYEARDYLTDELNHRLYLAGFADADDQAQTKLVMQADAAIGELEALSPATRVFQVVVGTVAYWFQPSHCGE